MIGKHFLAILLIVSLLAGGFLLPAQPAAGGTDIPELFTAARVVDAQPLGEAPHGRLRSQPLTINAAALQPLLVADESALAEHPLRLTLFPDLDFTTRWLWKESSITGGVTFIGTLAEAADSSVVLAWQDGRLLLTLSLPGGMYEVRPAQDDLYLAYQIDPASFPPEADEPFPPQGVEPQGSQVTGSPGGDDDGTRIDVLVVYTQAALDAAGGQAQMDNLINTAIADSNLAYTNSQITQRLTLVHRAQVDYSEDGFNWSTTLNRLTSTSDGYIDHVHTLRDTYAADLTMMVISYHYSSICGIAWVMDSEDLYFNYYGFSVVSRTCMTGLTPAHEMGHNMGSVHDRANSSFPGAFPYSYGYQSPAGKFYTVMAYASGCSGCSRIKYFSNPDVSYNGYPTGVPDGQSNSADNRKSLNYTADTVAKFRDGSAPAAPSALSAANYPVNQVRLTWTDNSSDESGFKVERAPQGSSTWTLIGSPAANATSFTDPAPLCGQTNRYRIQAFSGNGKSAYTAETTVIPCMPAAPTLTAATPKAVNAVDLTWTDNSNNEDGFRVERSPNGSSGWATVATLAANTVSYRDVGATCGSTVYYRVVAYNISGEGVSGNSSGINPCNMQSPTGLSGTVVSMARITLTWTDNAVNETGYKVERKLNSGGTWQQVTLTAANAAGYSDDSLECSTAYDFRVRATNAVGDAPYSATITRTTSACGVPPTPGSIQARPHGANALQVQWENIDGEDQYLLEWSPNGSDDWAPLATLNRNVNWYLHGGLTPGVTTYYRVQARNLSGDSGYSPVAAGSPNPYGAWLPVISR